MPDSTPLVRIRALVKRYGVAPAVDGLSLEVGPGEIVGLLGPNGAGKTTTLECLLGLRRPDSGEIALDGHDVLTQPAAARRRIGAQIQPAALQDKITPREALAFCAAFYESPAAIAELLARFGLTEKADARFDTLSSGQRQRLSVALAFVNRPALLVLDEPTTGLDPQTRRALHQILRDHRAAGGAVLLSTHDLDEAQRLCDRVAILHRGRLVADASPEELLTRSGAATRIEFRTARPFAFAGATSDADGVRHQLRSTKAASTVSAVTAAIEAGNNELVELRLSPPSLEDAFVALTGEGWDGQAEVAP